MKKALLILVFTMFTSVVFASDSTPALCPEPQKYTISQTEYVPFEAVSIVCPDKSAVEWAKKHLKQWYGKYAPEVGVANGETAKMGNEEYQLKINAQGAHIKANTLQGVRYALYTMRQLAIPARNTTTVQGWIVPLAEIEDKPDMTFRGMHICWFHEIKPWEIERMIRLAAYYKLNYAVIESWGTFQSKVAPWFGWDDGTMTYKEVKRLKAIADDLGITLIPQLNVFGHATNARVNSGKHATLDLKPKYQPYFEPLAGWNWCLTNPHTIALQKEIIKEMYELFGCPPYFHIGCDEATIPTCPNCVKESYSKLFAQQVREMSEYIKGLGAQTLMWHDMLIDKDDARWAGTPAHGTKQTASVVNNLPKDVVICDWYYKKPLERYNTLEYFSSLGFDVLACPWENKDGVESFIKASHKIGIKGVLGTLWHHYTGKRLVNSYFGVSNLTWNKNASMVVLGHALYNNRTTLQTHLRHVVWDMKIKDSRHAGTYFDEMPSEPALID